MRKIKVDIIKLYNATLKLKDKIEISSDLKSKRLSYKKDLMETMYHYSKMLNGVKYNLNSLILARLKLKQKEAQKSKNYNKISNRLYVLIHNEELKQELKNKILSKGFIIQ